MRSSKEWREADIIKLIDEKVPESLELEYKACDALQKIDGKKNEISKHISSFANSNGGVIVYGIKENGHLPDCIDVGFNPSNISREWLEQVINSKIHPKIEGLHINQIELPTKQPGYVLYVVTIPQATQRAPHQAADYKYYKRYNFQCVPMEDYEVKDVLRRGNSPDLYLNFRFLRGNTTPIIFLPDQDYSQDIELFISIENKSEEAALYAIIKVFLDTSIKIIDTAKMVLAEDVSNFQTEAGSIVPLNQLSLNWGIPGRLPIFKAVSFKITDEAVKIAIPNKHTELEKRYYNLIWQVNAPSMVNYGSKMLTLKDKYLTLDDYSS